MNFIETSLLKRFLIQRKMSKVKAMSAGGPPPRAHWVIRDDHVNETVNALAALCRLLLSQLAF